MIKNTDKKDKFLQRICLLLNLGDKNLCLVFFQTSVYFPLQLYLKNKAEMHKSTDIYGEREFKYRSFTSGSWIYQMWECVGNDDR